MSRADYRTSGDPVAIQLAEEIAEELSLPSSEDIYGWGASMAEDRESRWREGLS